MASTFLQSSKDSDHIFLTTRYPKNDLWWYEKHRCNIVVKNTGTLKLTSKCPLSESLIAAVTWYDSYVVGKETGHCVRSFWRNTYCITLKGTLFIAESFGCQTVVIFESCGQAGAEGECVWTTLFSWVKSCDYICA